MYTGCKILLCNSKEHAEDLSKKMLRKHQSEGKEPHYSEGTLRLFGINENFLSGQFGLWITRNSMHLLEKKYHDSLIIKDSFWVQEEYINENAEDFIAIGIGPIGIAKITPQENRKILDGFYNRGLIKKAKESGRIYNASVHDKAKVTINQIMSDPDNVQKLLLKINPYNFEELVAALLVDKGFSVILTPRSRDKGKDIIAATFIDGKPVIMLVECKKWNTNTLGPTSIKALFGQFIGDQRQNDMVSFASLVTTANSIGPEGIEFAQDNKELSLHEFEKLRKWILNYGKFRNDNLWLPDPLAEFI